MAPQQQKHEPRWKARHGAQPLHQRHRVHLSAATDQIGYAVSDGDPAFCGSLSPIRGRLIPAVRAAAAHHRHPGPASPERPGRSCAKTGHKRLNTAHSQTTGEVVSPDRRIRRLPLTTSASAVSPLPPPSCSASTIAAPVASGQARRSSSCGMRRCPSAVWRPIAARRQRSTNSSSAARTACDRQTAEGHRRIPLPR